MDRKKSTRHSRKRPIVLLSAYGCEPDKGSEGGVGWNWALQMARRSEVYVVTRSSRKNAVEAWLEKNEVSNPSFVYVDLPDWMLFFKRGTMGMNIYYMIWQVLAFFKAAPVVSEKGIQIAHHVSFMSLTRGSFVPFLGVKSVIGPIGGLQTVPASARGIIKSKVLESIRNLGVRFFRFNPVGRLTAAKADLLVMANGTNLHYLPEECQEKAVVGLQIGTHVIDARPAPPTEGETVFHWSGRFVDHKGLELLILAMEKLKSDEPQLYSKAKVVISGSGPLESYYRNLLKEKELNGSFEFLGWVTQDEMNAIWDRSHVFVFTSLRETTGMALQEAMMRTVAPIVIDNGGPGEMVTGDSGVKVSGDDLGSLVQDLAKALKKFIVSPDDAVRMGIEARKRALKHYSWDAVGEKMHTLYEGILEGTN